PSGEGKLSISTNNSVGFDICRMSRLKSNFKRKRAMNPDLCTSLADDAQNLDNKSTSNVSSNTEDESSMNVNDKPYGRPKSNVWQHATRINSQQANCNKCDKIISTSYGSTGTLRAHLAKQHEMIAFNKPLAELKKPHSIATDEKQKLYILAMKCIMEDGRSFNDLHKPGMAKLLNAIRPDTPSENPILKTPHISKAAVNISQQNGEWP
ncbi:unnamed protein product, partial [Didymodactylos carnosus]